MVIISFSVEKLWDKLWSGEKRRTMRPVIYAEKPNEKRRTMRPVIYAEKPNEKWKKVFDKFTADPNSPQFLQLYWKARSKNRKYLFTAYLNNITKKCLGDLSEEECEKDGFETKAECLTWFARTYKLSTEVVDHFEVYIIEWEAPVCNLCRHHLVCVDFFKTHNVNEKIYYKKWVNDYLCPAFQEFHATKCFPFPRFIDLTKIHDKTIVLPRDYFIAQNCSQCRNNHAIDFFQYCRKDPEFTDPEYEIRTLEECVEYRLHNNGAMVCQTFELGDPIIEDEDLISEKSDCLPDLLKEENKGDVNNNG